jgi:hypothetical protein
MVTNYLSEERTQIVFENRVLRRILGPKSEKLTISWRKLRKEHGI